MVSNNAGKTQRLLRFQLKLGMQAFEIDDVSEIKIDMFERGKAIERYLSDQYTIVEHICFLITTKHVKESKGGRYWDSKFTCVISEADDGIRRYFKVIGPKELAQAGVWTDEVKCLGAPYASNSKLNYDLSLN